MKRIFVAGAGKSATSLIQYLLKNAEEHQWTVTVGDREKAVAVKKINGHPAGTAIAFDVFDETLRAAQIADHDIIISLLPAKMHPMMSNDCLRLGKHIITPSYLQEADLEQDEAFKKAGLLFMGEMGLDPGIDHMSLIAMVDKIEDEGGKITALRSFTGGLVAPESDDNPWNYKFTWAPMNVVTAGQSTAQYLSKGLRQYLPYHRLFSLYENYHIDQYGDFEVYANRDSISYLKKYGLKDIPTFIRGTIRRKGFCDAWDAFVQLGWTDNSFPIVNSDRMTYNDLLRAFLPGKDTATSLRKQLAEFLEVEETGIVMKKLEWLGIFDHKLIQAKDATPAQILHDLLISKWEMKPHDKDMVVMLHVLNYTVGTEERQVQSSMIIKGEDAENTAMSQTVGWPLGIMAKLLATDQIKIRGVQIPIAKEVYEPTLKELESFGIQFAETHKIVSPSPA